MSKAQVGIEYLEKLTPWNGRGGFALDGIKKVLQRLDNPQDSLPIIHIAGTNGKGSVSSAISSILGAAGYRVGLNTSPHLQSVNERIVVDGLPIELSTLGELSYDIRNAAEREFVELSFHEAITAVSFLAFRELGLEWAVIEVGLGGRLDSSNVISRPAATAIVTIDFDHQAILGNTLAEIAAEKAGIIKPGSPLVSGHLGSEAYSVVSKKARGVRHYAYGVDYGCSPVAGADVDTFGYWGKDFPSKPICTFDFKSPLPGLHQGHNLAVAATLGLVVGMGEDVVQQGLRQVHWPARLERIGVGEINLIMDGAHNPAGIRSFIEHIRRTESKPIDLTFGVLDTKNWKEMVAMLAPFVSHWRLVRPDSDRALPLEQLRDEIVLSGNEVRVSIYGNDYERLLRELLDNSAEGTRYVTGSLYMIGKLRSMLSLAWKPLWQRAT